MGCNKSAKGADRMCIKHASALKLENAVSHQIMQLPVPIAPLGGAAAVAAFTAAQSPGYLNGAQRS